MRVATRRLRAALEVFEPCFPKKAHAAVLSEVKELADALGERRDRDVTIGALESFADELTAPDRPGSRASSPPCAPSSGRRTRRWPPASPTSESRGCVSA